MTTPLAPSSAKTTTHRLAFAAGVALAALGSFGAFVVTGSSLNSDRLISGGFERAFAGYHSSTARSGRSPLNGIVGSEDFWLNVPSDAAASVVKAVSIGREISVTGPHGERRMTVTDLRDISQAATHIATVTSRDSGVGGGASRTLLVTCREGADGAVHQIRLRFDDATARVTPALETPAAKAVPTT
jgi:hypothetical protein